MCYKCKVTVLETCTCNNCEILHGKDECTKCWHVPRDELSDQKNSKVRKVAFDN